MVAPADEGEGGGIRLLGLGVFHGGNDGEKRVEARHTKQIADACRGRREDEARPAALAAGVEINDLAETGGVHVGHVAEVEHGEDFAILAELGAEGAHIADDERAVQMKDATGRIGDGGDIDLKRFGLHVFAGGSWIYSGAIQHRQSGC